MNKKLKQSLTEMDDVTFNLLEHHFYLARLIRDTMSKRGLDDKSMADILGVSPRSMKYVKNASYEFDLILMAKLQTYNQEMAAGDAKFKIKAQEVKFSEYRDQYPIFVNRINKLLDILEDKNKCK